jgi:outer membrane protein assembly factor BamB
MPQRHSRIPLVALGLVPASVVLVLLLGEDRAAQAFIDVPAESLSKLCKMADAIAVVRVEKVNQEKKGIVYRKVLDLKGNFPSPNRQFGETFTHILRTSPNPDWHRQDFDLQDEQNGRILAWAGEAKTAVVFQRGGEILVCVGKSWYATRGNPPRGEHWVQVGGCDSRFLRFFCGDADQLAAVIPDVLQSKAVKVPCLAGDPRAVSSNTARLREIDANARAMDYSNMANGEIEPWSTHRGNAQRTGNTDGKPGPIAPKVLWTFRFETLTTSPVPRERQLYVGGLSGLNTPALYGLDTDPLAHDRVTFSRRMPCLKAPPAAAPALIDSRLVFGGMGQTEGADLSCVRASDGFPLWQQPLPGKLVHLEGTPAVVGGKLYLGAGHGGVVSVELNRVTYEDKELSLFEAEKVLAQRWQALTDHYQRARKQAPESAREPTDDMLPRPRPLWRWQQGKARWYVAAPLAVTHNRVVAASAYLEDDKVGERALLGLDPDHGRPHWKVPLRLNSWAGASIDGPFVLVGCSSIRLDPAAVQGARGEMVAVDLLTGQVTWRKDVPGGILSAAAFRDGLAVFTATDGMVRAWEVASGGERFRYDAGSPLFAGAAWVGGTIYIVGLDAVVHAVAVKDGKELWKLDLKTDPACKISGMVFDSPIVHGGRLYLTARNLGEKAARAPNVVVCIGEK